MNTLPKFIGTLTTVRTGKMDERSVCIGDIYQFGDTDECVQLRVVQPRRPCYKINDRLNTPNISSFVSHQGITGWYYQVVKTGIIKPDLPVYLIERPFEYATLHTLWQLVNQKSKIDAATAAQWLNIDCLESSWKQKIFNKTLRP